MDFWILGVMIVGFILTWIICCKPAKESDFDLKPGAFLPIEDSEKYRLRVENESLQRKVYMLERELHYRRYERPVEVNIDNIVKVETNETTSQSSCR